jgi:hypothetical protein
MTPTLHLPDVSHAEFAGWNARNHENSEGVSNEPWAYGRYCGPGTQDLTREPIDKLDEACWVCFFLN